MYLHNTVQCTTCIYPSCHLRALQAHGVRNPVRVPMEALVDYRGFRLSVMPFLPIHYVDAATGATVNKVRDERFDFLCGKGHACFALTYRCSTVCPLAHRVTGGVRFSRRWEDCASG